jgi:hypothetical protein
MQASIRHRGRCAGLEENIGALRRTFVSQLLSALRLKHRAVFYCG